jgi:hypothetical protein
MGDCSTNNCNPCGPDYNAINQLATRAGAYARQANTSAVDAANSAQNAENTWLEFNALYLGAFASAPTVDNEGNPLQNGALYWNSVSNELFAWNGTIWVATNFNEFTPFLATGTTFARNLVTRMADVVNVRDFGAVGDGVVDDTDAFSAAAFAAPAANNINGSRGTGVPRAVICYIYIPAGTYKLSTMVNTYGKEVVWELNQAAILSNPNNINGEVWRTAQRQTDEHHGSTDFACGMAFKNNGTSDSEAEVLGITSPSDLAVYTDRDTVGIYVDNASPPATLDSSSGTYTSKTVTTATIPSSDTVKKFRKGMIIDTKHSPAKWSGIVESWNANGTEFTVTDWYLVGGGGTPSTPTNGTGFVVNAFTKVWAHNANVALTAAGHANQACGFELGSFNYKGNPGAPGANPKVWGFDSVNLGPNKCESAFIARGDWWHGFESIGQATGFISRGGNVLSATGSGGQQIFYVNSNGNIELGGKLIAQQTFIDFSTSGSNNDFDSRIYCYGGNVNIGEGGMHLVSSIVQTRTLTPLVDNLYSLGSSGNRWTQVFAASPTINTSDEREKTFLSIENAEKSAALEIKLNLRKFKFNSAIEEKGDNARIHFGASAQQVADIMKSHDLDPNKYGFYCYDEWDEIQEVKDEKGNVMQEYRPAGNRYGLRYEELLAFIISAI